MPHLRRPVALALLLLLAAALPAPRARAEEGVATTPAIDRQDLERHLRFLTSEALAGRATTEPGAAEAADYIAHAFARFGLEPRGTEGYLQPYVVERPVLGEENELVARLPGEDGATVERRFEVERDWNPFSVSPHASVTGGLVFAGYGITAPGRGWDDYAGLDVTGKVVLVLRKDPGWNDARHASFLAKLGNAAKHGAVGLLLCNNPATVAGGPDRIGHWSAMIGAAAGAGTLPYAFVSQDVAQTLLAPLGGDAATLDAVEAALVAHGPRSAVVPGVEVRLATDVGRTSETNATNVVGWLPGRDEALRDEVVVVGAHYDHVGRGWFGSLGGPAAAGTIHPGADDNGSGTGALLELAEHFAVAANRPRRSLLFLAFSGEEMGLLGSQHWVESPTVPLEGIVTMVNLDMVGRCRQDHLDVGGVGTGTGLQDIVAAANAEAGFAITWDPQGEAPSDSTSFFRKHLPVLFFFTGLHEDYHRPTDCCDHLNFDGLVRVTRLVKDVVAAIADRDERVAYTDPPAVPRPPLLGIQLDPQGDPRGVAVLLASPGGPAEAAGVRPGDVIVALAGNIVRTPGDLMAVLRRLEAGRTVRLRVLRDDGPLELDVTPAERNGR